MRPRQIFAFSFILALAVALAVAISSAHAQAPVDSGDGSLEGRVALSLIVGTLAYAPPASVIPVGMQVWASDCEKSCYSDFPWAAHALFTGVGALGVAGITTGVSGSLGGNGSFGAALLGSAVGWGASLGVAAFSFSTDAGRLFLLTFSLPALGSVIGYELSNDGEPQDDLMSRSPSVQPAFAVLPEGGASLGLSGNF